ncbi:uncharacterized protein ACO6RY_12922 [Pungitius sinensis]
MSLQKKSRLRVTSCLPTSELEEERLQRDGDIKTSTGLYKNTPSKVRTSLEVLRSRSEDERGGAETGSGGGAVAADAHNFNVCYILAKSTNHLGGLLFWIVKQEEVRMRSFNLKGKLFHLLNLLK